MTKEEFEKEFKVGDIGRAGKFHKGVEIVCIGSDAYVTDGGECGVQVHLFSCSFQKVEPVKKYWKHVFTYAKDDEVYCEYYDHADKKSSNFNNRTYLKEPTEITLEDI